MRKRARCEARTGIPSEDVQKPPRRPGDVDVRVLRRDVLQRVRRGHADKVQPVRVLSFLALAPRAFSYPLKKGGWLLLLLGTALFVVLDVLSGAPFIGILFAVFWGGYLCAYMMKIIASSAKGEGEMPDWPAFRDFWADILAPYFSVLLTVVFALLPAVVYFFVGSEVPFDRAFAVLEDRAFLILFGCAFFYVPMALVALTIIGLGGALNPFLVLFSILKVFGQYLVACLLIAVLIALRVASARYLAGLGLIVGAVADGFLSLYFIVVEMRILGLIYCANEDRLGWFRR